MAYLFYELFSDIQKKHSTETCSQQIVKEISSVQYRTVTILFENGKSVQLQSPTVKKGDVLRHCEYAQ